MGSIGFEEMLIVAIVAIVIYGGTSPPSPARSPWYGKLKRQVTDMKDEIVRQIPDDDDFKAPPSSSEPDPRATRRPPPPPGSRVPILPTRSTRAPRRSILRGARPAAMNSRGARPESRNYG